MTIEKNCDGITSHRVLTSAWPSSSLTPGHGTRSSFRGRRRQSARRYAVLGVERILAVEVEEDRLVRAESLAQRLHRRRVEARVAQPGLRRVAGQHPEQDEVEGDDDQTVTSAHPTLRSR